MRCVPLRMPVLVVVAGLLSCEDSLVCPESWGDATAIPGQDQCAPPPGVVEAAEANLTTGIYGYITHDGSNDCDGSEREVKRSVYFTLTRPRGGGDFDTFNIPVGEEPTFEAELPPGEYGSYEWLLGAQGPLPYEDDGYDQRLVLAEGEVVFVTAQLSCGIGS